MNQQTDRMAFEETVLPHLDAAYNLARWITRNTEDAQDVVQESYLRAFKFFDGFHGGNARTWLLKIVRNTCYTWLHQNRADHPTALFDEQIHTDTSESQSPETLLLRKADRQLLNRTLEELPPAFREVLVLLELEELSYKEIADVLDIPIGTVMSRLARARHRLRESLSSHFPDAKAPSDAKAPRAANEDKSQGRANARAPQSEHPQSEHEHLPTGENLREIEFTPESSRSSESPIKR
jgi:RNA polymerase sigma-70 factor (ECF subfamily)